MRQGYSSLLGCFLAGQLASKYVRVIITWRRVSRGKLHGKPNRWSLCVDENPVGTWSRRVCLLFLNASFLSFFFSSFLVFFFFCCCCFSCLRRGAQLADSRWFQRKREFLGIACDWRYDTRTMLGISVLNFALTWHASTRLDVVRGLLWHLALTEWLLECRISITRRGSDLCCRVPNFLRPLPIGEYIRCFQTLLFNARFTRFVRHSRRHCILKRSWPHLCFRGIVRLAVRLRAFFLDALWLDSSIQVVVDVYMKAFFILFHLVSRFIQCAGQ